MSDFTIARARLHLHFQHFVTQAFLEVEPLDLALQVLMAGLTHPRGLDFKRAFLFLSDESNRELRVHSTFGPWSSSGMDSLAAGWDKAELEVGKLVQILSQHRPVFPIQGLTGLVVPLAVAVPDVPLTEEALPLQSIIAQCVARKVTWSSNQQRVLYQPPPGIRDEVLHLGPLAVVPLLLQQAVVGVLVVDQVGGGRALDADDLKSLSTLGNLASLAIHQSRLTRRLREMATLDGLTGVFNRRQFLIRLDKEIFLAKQDQRPLSVLVFTIQHFRKLNHTYGYECGDVILQDVTAFLKPRIRTEDVLSRFHEDTFAVALTGGAKEQDAQKVGEKLSQDLQSIKLGGLAQGVVHVACQSIWLPPESLDVDELERLTDQAMEQLLKPNRTN